MELRLLGPLDLVIGDRSLHIGGPRQQVILAMLALNVNKVTSIDTLIEAVWQTTPPITARGQVQVCISGLRKLFTEAGFPEAISTREPGYTLRLAPEYMDSLRFVKQLAAARVHIDAGRTVDAVTTLRAALALWRGPALAGVQSELVRRGATGVEELRAAAIEDRLRLELKLGWHLELVPELQSLIGEYPLRERLYGYLMLALYRCGRQAEALGIYRRARATLIGEVGVEPGPELQDLERAILHRDPSIDGPRVEAVHEAPAVRSEPLPELGRRMLPRQLPAGIADFTGRVVEIEEITRLLSEREARHAMQIVALSGRGGVGKSSLAVHVAHILNERFEDGVLYAELRGSTGGDGTAMQLARFLRALGMQGAAIPDEVGERVALYRSCLASRRVLVLLDDVIDEEQVLPLLPGSPTCAVITTSIHRLTGIPGAHHVTVNAFGPNESIEMLSRIIGPARVESEQTAVAELGELCDGLPLALRIAAARLSSRTRWPVSRLVHRLRDEVGRLDELEHRGWELRSSIALTHESLDESAERLFLLLSMIGATDVASWIGAALLDTDLSTAEETLERLVDAHVLEMVEFPDARGVRYRFHDLIRVYAREQLAKIEPGERDAALVRVLGAWLALAEFAHSKEYGGDYTIIHGSAPRWRPQNADLGLIVSDSMDWWDSERPALVAAVRQAADAGHHEVCWDLALSCTTLFESRGYYDDWKEVVGVALAAVQRAGSPTGIAAMTYLTGTLLMFQSRLTEAADCFRRAMDLFEAQGHDHGRGLVLRNWAHVDGLQGNSDEMMAKYGRALALLQDVGDRIGAAHVMRSQAKHWLASGDLTTARQLLGPALDICREVGCVRVESQVLHSFAELHTIAGDLDLAREQLNRVLRVVRDRGDRMGEAHVLYGLGIVRYQEGRLDTARAMVTHALEMARDCGDLMIEAKSHFTLGEIEIAQGDRESGVTHLRAAARLFEDLGATAWAAQARVLLPAVEGSDTDADSYSALTES
ncbi:AfsR/SARP family transcriptional regulator [Dactylosporangium sp. CA-092794]|uniref:AfsR/SARP family transcriptional regulator n=1 Tax=Dactylosporangium sp. CA-092794 TaxID=3239929 RepID=UPI003D8EC061